MQFQAINASLKTEATMDEAEEDSKKNGSDFSERYV
jgi:hypothetical protein